MASAISAQPVSPAISEVQLASAFNPEFDFLLACCASGSPSECAERIRRTRPLDWKRVVDLAEHHGVVPQLCRSLSDKPDVACPDSLRQANEINARKTLWLTRELWRILEKLNSCRVLALPYKGPLLAETLYGNVTQRQFSDLDLLISLSDLPRIKSALAELGYEPGIELTEREERDYLDSGYEYAFDSVHGRNLVEVQWRILPRFYSVDFEIKGFFERSIAFTLGGMTFRTLCAEDLLVVLCVHAAKHAWQQLSWLCDIAELARSQKIDWHVVQEQAKHLGIQRIVAVSFFLAHKLLDSPLPHVLRAQSQKGAPSKLRLGGGFAAIENLANEIIPVLAEGADYNPESISYFKLMIRVRERCHDRIKFLWRLIFTPSVGEWSVIPLPGPLFPLYPVIRLFRLMSRLMPLSSPEKASTKVASRETGRSGQ